MAQSNLDNLKNIQPLEINTTIFNGEPTELMSNVFAITTNAIGDIWFFFSIWALFIFFNWILYKAEEGFRYGIARSSLISSGFCFLISVAVLLSGWVNTIYPVIWFSSLLFLSFIAVYILKSKNQ